ncbi:MAG TPA: hypothetical protein VFL04_01785, partial [Rectinemataceae bacterium]|nr:hypothetical protein [Rectinemataceae bacterium]
MKRRRTSLLALAAASLALAAPLTAIEIGVEPHAGNVMIPWSQDTPTLGAQFPATNYFFGGSAWFTAPLGEDASIRVTYDRDPVLRNTVVAAVLFERGVAKIAVGPLVGLYNTAALPLSAGLSASVTLRWPGTAYVAIRSDGGLALSVLQTGTDPQARTELSAGFYVPNAIVSGVLVAKRFNETDANGNLKATDSFTRYALTVDIFKKNVPYTVLGSIGYELRSKKYVASAVTDTLGSVVAGADVSAQIAEGIRL